ncbi:MAG: shikimate dehydrogenase [Tissierellia bacterium]|nr:shikimate dehydrogenase [Tissierellia bacterium]
MKITWNTDIYCLIGHPISKTLSPIIHNSFYKLINANNIYLTFDVEKRDLETIINSFKILNIKGFNVTLPHKISIIKYLDDISEEAKIIGAINTVKNKNGKLIGHNTDGIGFLKSLELEGIDIKDRNILILGSGGAANAISVSVSMAGAKKIFISNRTLAKAEKLTKRIKKQFPEIAIEYGDLELKNVPKNEIDMVINCTSVGMYPKIHEAPIEFQGFSKNLIVYDLIYKPRKTKLIKMAQRRGYRTVGGLSMLINQALCSQNIWIENKNYNFANNFEKIRRILDTYVE